MAESIFSPSWYRVANLKPRLRLHTEIHRHEYRDELWYVLQDRNSGRYHRFTPAAYLVISLMDGERSVQEIWDLACVRLGDDVLTQDEMIGLLAQLHRANVLRGDTPTNVTELAERSARDKTRQRWMRVINPLALRLPLLDPDRFLAILMPFVRPLFSWAGALLIAMVVGYAGLLAVGHWPELTNNIGERVLATESLLLLLIAYPLIKALHELGHGLAVKHWGGEVHDMGVMLLVFRPFGVGDAVSVLPGGFQTKVKEIWTADGPLEEAFCPQSVTILLEDDPPPCQDRVRVGLSLQDRLHRGRDGPGNRSRGPALAGRKEDVAAG